MDKENTKLPNVDNPYGIPLQRIPAAASNVEYLRAAVDYLRERPMAGSGALAVLRHAEAALASALSRER